MSNMANAFLLIFVLWIQNAQGVYEYAAVCVPTTYKPGPSRNTCTMYLSSSSAGNATIATSSSSQTVQLVPGTLHTISFTAAMFPVDGPENKAIRIVADVETQVLLYKDELTGSSIYNDVYHAYNVDDAGTEYITVGFNDGRCTSTNHANQFFLVTSFYDETEITIKPKSSSSFDISLPSFGTYVQIAYVTTDQVAKGTTISSNKPINVISGNLCLDPASVIGGTALSNIPPLKSLGQHYMIPHIISQVPSLGFYLDVTAVDADTIVDLDGDVRILSAVADSTTFETTEQNWKLLNCSKDCLAVQLPKSDPSFQSGYFMLPMIPGQQFYSKVSFASAENFTSYISIAAEGQAPGDDILLNGESLGSLTWTSHDSGYSTAETLLSDTSNVLNSTSGRLFAAYVYFHSLLNRGGAGYAVQSQLFVEPSTAPTTTTTTTTTPPTTTMVLTTPAPLPSLPQLSVRLNGTVHTEDGQDMTPSCAQRHLQNLDAKTKAMVVSVNQAIGASICMDPDDVVVESGRATMGVDGAKAYLDIRHTLKVESYHEASTLESCAEEIGEFLSDHINWPRPIFPAEEGCSTLIFDPPGFDFKGSYWNCNSAKNEESSSAQNRLLFESIASEVFATSDGSVLDGDCIVAYSDESEKSTRRMMATIADVIADDPQCVGKVTIVTQAESFIGFGNQAFLQSSFYYAPNAVVTFDEFLSCVLPLHHFIQEHENWGTQPGSPMLPAPSGCPELEHDGSRLDDEGSSWACVDLI